MKEKFEEWGFADSFGRSYTELQYKLARPGMSVEGYDYQRSSERLDLAVSLAEIQAITAGIKLVTTPPPAVSNESDYDWHVEAESSNKTFSIENIDDLFDNPKKISDNSPEEWYKYFKNNGFNVSSLKRGSLKNVTFENGGGFKVNWGGDKMLQYHPSGLNHHGDKSYWKLSSGNFGTIRFDMDGNLLE